MWQKVRWCIGSITSDFIMHMEDILDQYEQPYDPKNPLICIDETPGQLIGDVMVPVPPKPGKPREIDYEYCRNSTCCVFIALDPHEGMRMIRIKEHRTKVDYADFITSGVQRVRVS